ncbi:Voltage dependent potassium channel [Trema orientale]|uniref:Voltage dependent potassium channel n=1 Tax=Trema orientale TaxID=63057 RepID=A0A2P5DY91_TREOI|nr:Voltage dependent potassium channel [Trema orientale]
MTSPSEDYASDFVVHCIRNNMLQYRTDIVVDVGGTLMDLHKLPLSSSSRVMEKLIAEAESEERCSIQLPELPGGAKIFELVAKFCCGQKLELTASETVYLRCAAEYLEMTEEYGEGNLISETETFLNDVILKNWKDSLRALRTCEKILDYAEELNITERCIESLIAQVFIREHDKSIQSLDWWYEDVLSLSFPLYKRLISVMEIRGIKHETIAGSIAFYVKKYLPWLTGSRVRNVASLRKSMSKDEKFLLEEFDRLLPMQRGLVPTKFLSGVLRTAMIVQANPSCISNLEKRIGMQLDHATLEDLLMLSTSDTMETLYDVDCVRRIMAHFFAMHHVIDSASPCSTDDGQLIGSSSLTPLTMVAKLIDGYLAKVACDIYLKPLKFQELVDAVPHYARSLDDGLYHAIDVYLKSHPWLVQSERQQLFRLLDIQKLSTAACTHATQNERLPLRILFQLCFEQLHLSTTDERENPEVVKFEKNDMPMQAKNSSSTWGSVSKRFGFNMCSAPEGSVIDSHQGPRKVERLKEKHEKVTRK